MKLVVHLSDGKKLVRKDVKFGYDFSDVRGGPHPDGNLIISTLEEKPRITDVINKRFWVRIEVEQ